MAVGTDVAAQGDSRFPSSGEKQALAGTSGTPGSGNAYVTNNDSRNTNARTPTTHAASHQNGGVDEIATVTPGANVIPKAGGDGKVALGFIPTASQAEAEAGTDNTKLVTPLRVKQAIDALAPAGDGTPGGSDTQCQFNDGGAFGGDSGCTFNKTTKKLTIAGDIESGDGTVPGEVQMRELAANGNDYISWLVQGAITSALKLRLPNANPAANQALRFGAPSSGISDAGWSTPLWSDTAAASQVANTPAGGVSATNVQNAINELDAEKQPLNSNLTQLSSLTCEEGEIPKKISGNWECVEDGGSGPAMAPYSTTVSAQTSVSNRRPLTVRER